MLADIVETRRDRGRFLGDVLERFAERRELGAAGGERRQHGADGGALFARRGNERLQLFCLLLDQLAFAGDVLERVQHIGFAPELEMEWGDVKIMNSTVSVSALARSLMNCPFCQDLRALASQFLMPEARLASLTD